MSDKEDEHPLLSAQWLLSAATGLSRVQLYVDYDKPLNESELSTLHDGIVRRAKGEPLQYITGEVGFRHLVCAVRSGVLIPRPETEVLVGEVLTYLSELTHAPLVGEIGTGSGCIAASLATELPDVQVVATDISADAISLASENVERAHATPQVTLIECDLFSKVEARLKGSFDVLVSNPPYIPRALLDTLSAEVRCFEPTLALDGGEDGLDFFNRLLEVGHEWLAAGGLLAVELHETTLEEAARRAQNSGYVNVRIVRDLTDKPRILLAQK